ncbi:hypothetical protein [Actinospica sp.]|uniref:hypothetical protein n=1 Tax=Actinospica sp. TaxID=1872142 RepID=UPI002C9F4AD0|nr:hypothetical protein [Actinospica sp.]HWG27187.1 hypothetical protein [Actinospica sp.]
MKRQRRTTDPLAPLLPVVRVAAVGLVAAGGSLVAVHALDAPASAQLGATAPTSAAKLVAIPRYAEQAKRTTSSATITGHAKIARVAAIINALPPAPTGAFSCPADFGGGLELDFESTGGAVLEQVSMDASGCGGTSVTINGARQPERSSSRDTIQQIQGILGTNWQLLPTLPG